MELISAFSQADLSAEAVSPREVPLQSCGWGMAAVDLNNDGETDLVQLGPTDRMWPLVNTNGVLTPSREITFGGGPMPAGNGIGVGDMNNDGLPDLVVVRSQGTPDLIYWNSGDGTFVEEELKLSTAESQHATLFDADLDGDLDLYVSRHIDVRDYQILDVMAGTTRGNENGFYRNINGVLTPESMGVVADGASFQAVPIDADQDGDLDLYVLNDFGMFIEPNQLLVNDGAGHFSSASDCQCDLEIYAMGGSVGDFNNDGIADLHVTNFGTPRTLMGMGDGSFVDATAAAGTLLVADGTRSASWGTLFVDLDQDGWEDILTAYGPVIIGTTEDWTQGIDHPTVAGWNEIPSQPDSFLRNLGGSFEEQAQVLGLDVPRASRAIVKADFNGDGMPDIAVSSYASAIQQEVRVYQGTAGCGPGITVAFPERGGRDVGTRIEWTVGGREYTRWFQPGTTYSASGPSVHLGLGGHAAAEVVRITPLGGEPTEWVDLPAGSRIDQRSYQ